MLLERALTLAAGTDRRLARARVTRLPASEGGQNIVGRARVGARTVFIKVRTEPRDDGRRERWALELLRRTSGIAPALLWSGTVRSVAADLAARGEVHALVESELHGGGILITEGLRGEQRTELDEAAIGMLARTLARLHAHKPKDQDKPLVGGATALAAHGFAASCLETLEEARALAPKALVATRRALKEARVALDAEWWGFAGSVPRVLCHGDVRPANLLFTRDACALIDFEHAGLGDPMIDLGRAAVYARFGRHQELCLLDAYAEATGDVDALDRYFVARRVLPLASALAGAVHVLRMARGEKRAAGEGYLKARTRVVEEQLASVVETPVKLALGAAARTRGIIAIDGLAGTGKTPIASSLARRLRVPHINTGAAYRGAALLALDLGLEPERHADVIALIAALKRARPALTADGALTLGTHRLTHALDVLPVEETVARWARLPDLRAALAPILRRAVKAPAAVVEGRDIKTVLCPDARWSFFVDVDKRALAANVKARGGKDAQRLARAISQRNALDVKRALAPAVAAKTAVRIVAGDDIEDAVDAILKRMRVRP